MLRGLLILESNPKTLFLFGVGKLGKLTCLSFPNDKQTVKDNSEYINPFRQMPNLMAMLSLSKSPFFLFWTGKSEQALGQRLQKIKQVLKMRLNS